MADVDTIDGLPKVKGLGAARIKALIQSGFKSIGDIQKTSIEDIAAVKGIGLSLAEDIKKAVEKAGVKEPTKLVLGEVREGLLRVRRRQKSKLPLFRRCDSQKKKRVGESWRRPRGIHNKQRSEIRAKGAIVRVGYGSPRGVRGLHPSGYEEVLVHNPKEVEGIKPSTQAIRISGPVGLKKRLDIEEKAGELGVKILNPIKRE